MAVHLLLGRRVRRGGAHAVVAQAAGAYGAGHEARTEGVHFREWADFAGVAEGVGVGAACE